MSKRKAISKKKFVPTVQSTGQYTSGTERFNPIHVSTVPYGKENNEKKKS